MGPAHGRATVYPRGISDQQRQGHRQQRGQPGQQHAVAGQPQKLHAELGVAIGQRHARQQQRGQAETTGQRQRASGHRQRLAYTAQPAAGGGAAVQAGVGVAAPAPAGAFKQQHQRDKAQQHQRQLRRGGPVAQREPGPVDARGEGLHREVADGAEVGQRLHQRQRHATGDGRPRHRQRDAQKALPGCQPQRAGDLDHRVATLDEGRARHQVNIGVEHQREHDHRAAGRPHVGKPIVSAAPAKGLAQRRLQRAHVLQQVGVAVGHHVGRHRQRQDQRPFKHRPAGKVMPCHQPGRPDAQQRDTDADPATQVQGGDHIVGQNGG